MEHSSEISEYNTARETRFCGKLRLKSITKSCEIVLLRTHRQKESPVPINYCATMNTLTTEQWVTICACVFVVNFIFK